MAEVCRSGGPWILNGVRTDIQGNIQHQWESGLMRHLQYSDCLYG